MASTLYLLNSPLINYFHYKSGDEIGELLADGKIYFWEDENHTIAAPTYSDPNGTVVNTNPIDLSVVGSCPPIYMEDRLYFIEIYDSEGKAGGNLIESLDGYIPNGNSSQTTSGTDDNLLSNPQFNYPIAFYKTSDPVGRISQAITAIAYGWQFIMDSPTATGATTNTITFGDISNENLPGNPRWECVLNSATGTVTETVKDFQQILGEVNIFAGEQLTLTLQGRSLLSGSQDVELILEKNFGTDGSPTEFETITTFSFETTRSQFTFVYTFPTNTGKTIGEDNYIALRIRGALNQTANFGFTNLGVFKGKIESPVISDTSGSKEKSQIVGEGIQIEETSLNNNYSRLIYNDGKIVPTNLTGAVEINQVTNLRPDQKPCDGSSYKVSGYISDVIPNKRLFDVIKDNYAKAGDIVVVAKDNTVEFSSGVGARESTPYTNGNTGSAISVEQVKKGQLADVSCSLKSGTSDTIVIDWLDQFVVSTAIGPSYEGRSAYPAVQSARTIYDWYTVEVSGISTAPIHYYDDIFLITDILPGSVSTNAQAEIKVLKNPGSFLLSAIDQWYGGYDYYVKFIDWPVATYNTHANPVSNGTPTPAGVMVYFSVDGKSGNILNGSYATVTVPLLSTDSISQFINKFINAIDNPFEWKFTVNSVPAASSYCFYSVASTASNPDRYFWFEVDGSGSDPGPFTSPTRATPQGTKIAISSTDTPKSIASKIASALDDLTFEVPDQSTDLPAIPNSNMTWAINF